MKDSIFAKFKFPIGSYFKVENRGSFSIIQMTPMGYASIEKEKQWHKYTYFYTPFKVRFQLFMSSLYDIYILFKMALKFLIFDKKSSVKKS